MDVLQSKPQTQGSALGSVSPTQCKPTMHGLRPVHSGEVPGANRASLRAGSGPQDCLSAVIKIPNNPDFQGYLTHVQGTHARMGRSYVSTWCLSALGKGARGKHARLQARDGPQRQVGQRAAHAPRGRGAGRARDAVQPEHMRQVAALQNRRVSVGTYASNIQIVVVISE